MAENGRLNFKTCGIFKLSYTADAALCETRKSKVRNMMKLHSQILKFIFFRAPKITPII
jgi:hypothetical protein